MKDFTMKMMNSEELCVQRVSLFQNLDLAKQKRIEQLTHHRHVQAHEIILSPVKNNDQLVILDQGAARMYRLNPNGNEQVTRLLESGDYVGETWLLGIENENDYLESVQPCEICTIQRDAFEKLLTEDIAIALELLKEQVQHNVDLRHQNELLSIPNTQKRIIAYLTGLQQQQGMHIHLPFNLKDVASYLGTTPENLTRNLKSLAKSGKIRYYLKDIEILERL